MLQPKPYTEAIDQWNVGVVAYTLFVLALHTHRRLMRRGW